MSVRLAIAVCVVCLVPFQRALADPAPAGGLEYDEISFLNPDAAAHPPGAFDGDLAAIKTAVLAGQLGTVDERQRVARLKQEFSNPALKVAMMAAARAPGGAGILAALILDATIRGKIAAEGAAMGTEVHDAYVTEQRLGKWYHVVFLNGWTRREDVPNQTVLIVKPDKNQRIHLDLATQTYYTTPSTDSPQTAASTRAVMCSPSTTLDRGPKTLDGAATEIFETSFAAPRMSVTVTRYASSYVEPPERTVTGDLIPFDCLSSAAHTGPSMLTDHIALYQTMTASNGAVTTSQLDEIGNVRQGDQDSALFEVPAGFKEKRPGDIMNP
jgi:hypothetical protein